MELTKKDRIILINQYRILAKLNPDESSHYEELIEILQNGYEIFYSEMTSWIYDPMTSDKGDFVLNILNFYRFLENYKKNNPEDKEMSENLWSIFRGFGGNDESEYLSFTEFLIERQNKFIEQVKYKEETDNFNSHFPVLEKYKKMLAKWKDFKHEVGELWTLASKKWDLSNEKDKALRDKLLEILNA